MGFVGQLLSSPHVSCRPWGHRSAMRGNPLSRVARKRPASGPETCIHNGTSRKLPVDSNLRR